MFGSGQGGTDGVFVRHRKCGLDVTYLTLHVTGVVAAGAAAEVDVVAMVPTHYE